MAQINARKKKSPPETQITQWRLRAQLFGLVPMAIAIIIIGIIGYRHVSSSSAAPLPTPVITGP